MRLMVTTDDRFLRRRDGNIYSTTVCDYGFWCRYLEVFDEVLVLARVAEALENELRKSPANGPRVCFLALPTFIGPWQLLGHYREMNALAKNAIGKADAFLLRVPGTVSTLLWRCLKRREIPYGVEVTGDPWEALSPAGVKSIVSPLARYTMTAFLKKQCRDACVAAHVTERYLQQKYPPGGWSTHYSSAELLNEAIIEEEDLAAHLASIYDAVNGKRPLRICHMGTMSVLYKRQDILLEAVSLCRKRGRNIELTLLGEGQYYQYYLDKAKKLGLMEYVNFLGQLPPGKAVIEQLDAADLFVLPSFTEGLPRSLIEAMARGLPCLASRAGGIPELLADEYLFPPKDSVALAKAIESLFVDRRKIEKMARQNLRTAKKYCADGLKCRRKALYQKLKEKTERWYSKQSQK